MNLFTQALEQRLLTEIPHAARLRTLTLYEYIDQEDILNPGKLLRRAIESAGNGHCQQTR